jgi:hypothetical protein
MSFFLEVNGTTELDSNTDEQMDFRKKPIERIIEPAFVEMTVQ